MNYRVTARYGGRQQRYHTYDVQADDAKAALTAAAEALPSEIAAETDLVELRVSVDPEERTYVEEGADLDRR
jgi:hypothetical protein